MRTAREWAEAQYDGYLYSPEAWIEMKTVDAERLYQEIQADAVEWALQQFGQGASKALSTIAEKYTQLRTVST